MINHNTPRRYLTIEESDLVGVRKGTFLPKEWCQRYIGISANHDNQEYRLRLLALQNRIEALLCRRDDDDGIIVKQEGLGLQVLSDEQAVPYSAHRQGIALRHWKKMARKQMAIDDSKLPDDVRALHHHQLNVSMRMANAMDRVLKEQSELKKARRMTDTSARFAQPHRIR